MGFPIMLSSLAIVVDKPQEALGGKDGNLG